MMIAGVITPRMTAYSAIVWASMRLHRLRMPRIRLCNAISGKSAPYSAARMPHLGDPPQLRSYGRAAATRGFGGPADPAWACARGRPAKRDLLLSLVLEHAARRPVRPLDTGRPHAAVRHRVAVLSGPRSVLERGPADSPRADARHRGCGDRRGDQLVVGEGITGRSASWCSDARGEAATSPGRGPARTVSR